MHIALATLADWAATTDMGKLVIGGVFDTIRVRELPATHPMMVLALRMSVEPGEPAAHEVAVRVVDPDGEPVVPELKGRLQLGHSPSTQGAGMQFVLHMPNVSFAKPGPHAVDIFLDGVHRQSLPLHVRVIEETPSSAQDGVAS